VINIATRWFAIAAAENALRAASDAYAALPSPDTRDDVIACQRRAEAAGLAFAAACQNAVEIVGWRQ
jgi:hypothetical protein